MSGFPAPMYAPPPPPDVTARRGGMIAWGVVLIVIGAVAALGLFALMFDWLGWAEQSLVNESASARRRARTRTPAPPNVRLPELAGVLIALAGAVATVWAGIGCCMARRWVRPVVVAGGVFVMSVGLLIFTAMALTLPAVITALEAAAAKNVATPNPYSLVTVFALRASLVLAAGVVVPYFAVRFFLSSRTAAALDVLDPRVTWADRAPIPVLGWAAFAAFAALTMLLRLQHPALPVFVTVLKGGPAIIAQSVAAVLLAWGAWLCWRTDRAGWFLTFVLLVGLRVSAATYLWTGGAPEDLAGDVTAAVAGSPKRGLTPEWLPAVMATLEALLVAGIGLYAGAKFPAAGAARATSARGFEPLPLPPDHEQSPPGI